MNEDEIERLAKSLWERENHSKPWATPTSRRVLGQDVETGATEEERERYRDRVRHGDR
ncbi:hypothetical protein J2W42_006726 [Rhizobium tibeticum]|uniref:Uncharacterized protein n=1 Tax=Rhizobium tibeticum TaxID=501024 RepID=A0A1H8VE41_9HYPH|nr:hypothetical protein [Rhizobium tibeticum]MDP9813850.1 hypothetical protein [Rhizobium tibeticum]SEI18658.1 hypothetical protein RTCCBAU85039_5959 [Rhizobium tibeticum]SEP13467.1 hypothetical protein SAMN05216228_104151 [Rhizobium tibeticum]